MGDGEKMDDGPWTVDRRLGIAGQFLGVVL